MIVFRNSLLLTAGIFGSVAVALAALDDPQPATADSNASALPDEIAAAEADYEIRQQGIEQAIARVVRGAMDRSPEERRELFSRWMRENRSLLEEQMAYSAEIDALYVQHGLTGAGQSAETAPPDQEDSASRPLASTLMTLLREHESDPEARREIFTQWMEVNGEALQEEEKAFQTNMAALSGPPAPEPRLSDAGEASPADSLTEQPVSLEDTAPPDGPPASVPEEVLAQAPEDPELRREHLFPHLEAAAAVNEPFFESLAAEAEQATARSIHENQ